MKRVLWVNPSFLDYRIPLYEELNRLYENNFFLVYSKSRVPQRCVSKIDQKLGVNAKGLEKEKIYSYSKSEFANKGITLPFPKGLYKLIKSVNADVIITEGFFQFTPWALLYAILHRKPLIVAYERTAHTERNCPWWRRLYRRFVNFFVSGYVVNGILTKDYLISQGVNPDVIFTGAMCADSKGLAEQVSSMTEQEKRDFKDTVLGSSSCCGLSYILVGRMITLKGVNYALESWEVHQKKYPDDRLIVVGDGPLLEEYTKKYEKYSSIIFTGGVDYSNIYKYYAIANVFLIATLEDNWSLVVPEAMACGLPVACSIYNGCYPELVHENVNGILFDPLLQESILNAFAYFHSVDLKKFGQNSIEIESKFSPHQVALNIFNAVESLYRN